MHRIVVDGRPSTVVRKTNHQRAPEPVPGLHPLASGPVVPLDPPGEMPGGGGLTATVFRMTEMLIGYARCSTDEQDLTSQRDALSRLGVSAKRIYVDHGLTGANRARPGLREALAACRAGDTLVVTKLDRLLAGCTRHR